MKKIKFVAFQSPLFIPELGNVGDSLPSPKKSLPDLTMWETEGGVGFSAATVSGVIPYPQCKIYIYAPEAKVAKGKA